MVFAVLLGATVLLISGRLRADITALLTLIVLALTGLVSAQEAFASFGRSAVIIILSIFIITNALERTGVTRVIGDRLLRLAGKTEARLVPVIMLAGAGLSLVMNNIAAGAVLLPALIGITRQTDLKPSKLLMPLAFATMLGGMATLLTTSNILVSNALRESGLEGFSLFSFAPIGVPVIIVGILYMTLIGRHMLPDTNPAGQMRAAPNPAELVAMYGLKEGVCQIYVRAGSSMGGVSVASGGWSEKLGLTVIGISRGGEIILSPGKTFEVLEGDVVLAGGQIDDDGLGYYGLVRTTDSTWEGNFASDEIDLVEVILAPRSEFAKKTLREINFREHYGVTVLSIWRDGAILRDALGDIPLKLGDALLVQGPRAKIKLLRTEPNLLVLDEGDDVPTMQPRKGPMAAVIVVAALTLATLNLLPVAEAFFAAALALVLTNCITMDEAYKAIEWRAIFLIAGFLPLGIALESTGAAAYVGQWLVASLGKFGAPALAGGLFLVTALALQVVGNVGSAVIFAPIAISAAQQMGSDPRGFAMAVALGTSMAFLIPTAHPVNVMMMGPGGYTVKDYARVGLPLTVILFVVVVVGLVLFWNIR